MSTRKAKVKAVQPVLMSRDVQNSIEFYRGLGFELIFRDSDVAPKYAGVARDGVQLHLQWADPTQWRTTGDRPIYRFVVSDVDSLYREFQASGAITEISERESKWSVPSNTSWGTYEFHLRDPDENGLQFYEVR